METTNAEGVFKHPSSKESSSEEHRLLAPAGNEVARSAAKVEQKWPTESETKFFPGSLYVCQFSSMLLPLDNQKGLH